MRICIYVYISLCIWIALFFFVTSGTRGIKGVNNIISPRRAAPVLRDHYNFITSSHSNIDDDGDGDDVSGEFSCVILEAAWARSPLRSDLIEPPLDATLGHDVFRRHFPVAHTSDSMDLNDCTRFLKSRRPGEILQVAGEEKPRRLVEISRSRVGTLGWVSRRFQRLERF